MGAWIMAVLLAAVALVIPAAARSAAGAATVTAAAFQTTTPPVPPSPTATPGYRCAESPVTPPNTPPSAPGTPEVVGVVMTTVRLRWEPATDEDGIGCYYVREVRNGREVTVAGFAPTATQGDFYLPWPPSGVASEVHHLYVVAVDTKGAVGPASETVAVTVYNDIVPSPSASPSPTCRVEYRSVDWQAGMTTSIAITNTGATAVRDWRLRFTFPDPRQSVTYGWAATWAQTGAEVTATAMNWNRDIAPGQTVHIGFGGGHGGANPSPTVFRLNGSVCA